jgi:hypothetical protein
MLTPAWLEPHARQESSCSFGLFPCFAFGIPRLWQTGVTDVQCGLRRPVKTWSFTAWLLYTIHDIVTMMPDRQQAM